MKATTKLKILLILWGLILLNVPASGQVVYRDVTKKVNGVTTVYTVARDLNVYPATSQGDAALQSAIRAGQIPLIVPAKTAQAVGSFTYKPTLSFSSDFAGTAIVKTAAPVLIGANRTVPRLVGNYFSFSPQQAKQAGILRRLPAFSLHPSKLVVYAGPNFSDPIDRVQLSRGYTDLDQCVQGRELINASRYVPLVQSGYQGLAGTAAAPLPDGDARKVALLRWVNGKYFISNPDAAKLYGRAIYADLLAKSGGGNPTGYSLDFEDGQPENGQDFFTAWSSMVGYVMQGVKDAATDAGRPVPVPIQYDFSAISPFGLTCSSADQEANGTVNDGCNGISGLDSPEPGIPYYFHYKSLYFTWAGGSKAAPLGSSTPIASYARNNPAAFGQAEYANAPWDEQSLWQKNSDGSFKTRTVGGKTLLTIRTDQRNATLYGVTVPILSDDAYQYLYKGRERIQQAVLDMYWRAGGKHLPLSTDRQPGFENLKLMQYFRFDAEFKGRDQQGQDGEVLNRRPLNADFLERDVIVHSLLRDVLRVFGENGPMIQQGIAGVVTSNNYNTNDPLKSKGPVEIFTKGLYRASGLNYLADTPWQLVCPRYYVHRLKEEQPFFLPQDQPEKNPIVLGGLVPGATGGAKLWLLWSYDCQDVDQKRDLNFWYVKDDGTISPNSYRVQFLGRKTGLDDLLLPAGFSGIAPKNIRFRFTDMTGEQQTITGDYRVTGTNAETMPPLIAGSGTTTITPPATTTVASTTAAPSWISGFTYSLSSANLLTFEGSGDIGQLKFEKQDGSSFSTTNPGGVTVVSGQFYGYGPLSGQGIYDRQWQLILPEAPLKITARRGSNAADTFTYLFVPVSGTLRANLTGSSSATTTPGSTTTTTPYSYTQSVEAETANGPGTLYPKSSASGGTIKDGPLTYSFTGVPATASYTLLLRYQTNTNGATGTINGTAFQLPATDGSLASFTASINLSAGANAVVISISSGYLASDVLTITGSGTGGGSGPPAPERTGGSSTYPAFVWGAIIGNSFTSHSASTAINWNQNNGMAASDLMHDYVHVVESAIRTSSPSFQLAAMPQGSSFELGYSSPNGDDLTNIIININYDLTGVQNANRIFPTGTTLDLLIVSIGENINAGAFNETQFRAGMDRLIAGIPLSAGATILLRNSFWAGADAFNAVMQSYAASHGYKFANLDDIRERSDYKASYRPVGPGEMAYSDAGVQHHPNNAGHAAIASRILAQLSTGTGGGGGGGPPSSTATTGNVDADGFLVYDDQGWAGGDAADLKYVENDKIKIGFRRSVGASICYAALKSTGENLDNDYRVNDTRSDDPLGRQGQVISDKGRQWMWSDYFTPGNNWLVTPGNGQDYSINGANGNGGTRKNTGFYGFDTGGNTVQGGSLGNWYDESLVIKSAIVNDPVRGQVFCAKIRPRVWAVPREFANVVVDEEVWTENYVTRVKARHIIEPASINGRINQSRQQENPSMYILPTMTRHRAVTGTPFVNSGSIDRFPYGYNQPGHSNFSDPVRTTEHWIGAYRNSDGIGITLYDPANANFNTGQFVGEDGIASGNPASYINGASQVNYDNAGSYLNDVYIIVGQTESQARSIIYNNLPRPSQAFSFDFTGTNNRFANSDCRVIKESGEGISVYIGDPHVDGQTSYRGNFMSPCRSWEAGQFSTFKITYKATGVSKLNLKWLKPGDDRTEYYKPFDIINDGQFHATTVSTSDPNWSGIISSVGIQAFNDGNFTQTGAKLIISKLEK